MHIHILGIGGTFMGGIACLAAERGYRVTGSDENIYPPMSTQLEQLGIVWQEGYDNMPSLPKPDMVVIGNALKRGNPAVEYVLNEGLPYQSGPQWLAENLLYNKWVIAVSGTHGKTTTSSMVAWILHDAGWEPGYLIGGIPENLGLSAKSGQGSHFVVEADEYDCAFFDKRSKFVHYRPRTCVINNLEFDHADIFNNLADIQKQFHHLVRTVPGKGTIIVPSGEAAVNDVLAMGVWSDVHTFGLTQADWQAYTHHTDGHAFDIYHQGQKKGTVEWELIGMHNVHNALAAIAAAFQVGVPADVAIKALMTFQSVKRRMEVKGRVQGITVYDDFAHHPTAIDTTIRGLKAKVGSERVLAVLDIRSNTMKMGTHQAELANSLSVADKVYVFQSAAIAWSVSEALASLGEKVHIFQDTQNIIDSLLAESIEKDHILIMSNGGFDNIHARLLHALNARSKQGEEIAV